MAASGLVIVRQYDHIRTTQLFSMGHGPFARTFGIAGCSEVPTFSPQSVDLGLALNNKNEPLIFDCLDEFRQFVWNVLPVLWLLVPTGVELQAALYLLARRRIHDWFFLA